MFGFGGRRRAREKGRMKNGKALGTGTGKRKCVCRGWRRRRSGSVKSYCTKSIFVAHYGKHIRSCACCRKSRKFTMTGGVVHGDTNMRRVWLHSMGGSKTWWWEAAFKCVCLRMNVYKGGAPCNRISTWRETQAQSSSLMRGRTWSESDGVPRAHSPPQKVPPDTLCYLQVSWDQPMNHVTRWFPG